MGVFQVKTQNHEYNHADDYNDDDDDDDDDDDGDYGDDNDVGLILATKKMNILGRHCTAPPRGG